MSAPVEESVWTSGDANPPPGVTSQPEPVATEPYARVTSESELNEENVLDIDANEKNTANERDKHAETSPLERSTSSWTSRSSGDDSQKEKNVAEEKRSWSERLNPLKKKTKPPIPEQRQVSREYGASFWSLLTFQWMAPIMSVSKIEVWNLFYQLTVNRLDINVR